LHDFGKMDGFDEAFGAAGFCWANGLRVEDARCHAGCGIEEPGTEMRYGLLDVARVVGDNEGCSEGRNADAKVEQRVAVCGEGVGIG